MSNTIDYQNLTKEQKQQLREQIEAEEKARKEAEKKLRKDYEHLKDQLVEPTFNKLWGTSVSLQEQKENIFDDFKTLLELKKELYNLTDKQMELQQSHTFTNSKNTVKIIIGSNVIDGWTDDVHVGIEGVKNWVMKEIEPKNRDIFLALLKPNKDGALKASRVLDLSQKAHERGDQELIKHVDFIKEQYQPVKTSTYVKARYIDDNGRWQWLALSMSAV
ncbi:MAG: DUF3164 family protein [Bacteroidales bacterium]|nr:DUF3164 family protein [Bacteroidales bacterium]